MRTAASKSSLIPYRKNQLFRSVSLVAGILFIGFLMNACTTDMTAKLTGAWEIDSVFDYHNGFTFTNKHPSPKEIHEYHADGTMLRKGMGEVKQYYYELNGKRLAIRDLPNASTANEMEIIKLDNDQLVLRKNKRPLFENKNEIRYELRYFSRRKP